MTDAERSQGVIVVGSLNEDVVLVLAGPVSRGATVLTDDVRLLPGGKGLNQAVAAAAAGVRTVLVGAVGDDDAGRRLVARAAAAGIDVAFVSTTVERPTGRAYIAVEPDGSSTIVVDPGANLTLDVGDLDAVGDAAVLVVQLEIPAGSAAAALEWAQRRRITTLLSASPVTPAARGLIALADIVICNRNEGIELTGLARDAEAADVASALCDLGAAASCLTLGAEGAIVATPASSDRVAAAAVAHVVDTTGAGDAATGAFAASYAHTPDLLVAARAAMAAGAASVSGVGALGDVVPGG